MPPAISTLPFGSNVAVWLKRAAVVLPVGNSFPGPTGVRVASASRTRRQNSVKAESPNFARKFISILYPSIYQYRTYSGRCGLAGAKAYALKKDQYLSFCCSMGDLASVLSNSRLIRRLAKEGRGPRKLAVLFLSIFLKDGMHLLHRGALR
jgi:hypothetical protein